MKSLCVRSRSRVFGQRALLHIRPRILNLLRCLQLVVSPLETCVDLFGQVRWVGSCRNEFLPQKHQDQPSPMVEHHHKLNEQPDVDQESISSLTMSSSCDRMEGVGTGLR
jgi:hypothetical protein